MHPTDQTPPSPKNLTSIKSHFNINFHHQFSSSIFIINPYHQSSSSPIHHRHPPPSISHPPIPSPPPLTHSPPLGSNIKHPLPETEKKAGKISRRCSLSQKAFFEFSSHNRDVEPGFENERRFKNEEISMSMGLDLWMGI